MNFDNINQELKSISKEKDWRVAFLGTNKYGENAVKVYFFKTDKVLELYDYSKDDINDFLPSISNDGTKVAFWVKNNKNQSVLYTINSDGSSLQKVVSVENGHGIVWSPDNQKIAFCNYRVDHQTKVQLASLFIVNLKTKQHQSILEGNIDGIANQSWSNDGNKLLYSYKGNVCFYDFLLKSSHVIDRGQMYALSPINNKIAYLQERNLVITTFDGLEKKIEFNINSNGINSPPFLWLPSRDYILFSKDSNNPTAEIGTPILFNLSTNKEQELSEGWISFSSWGGAKKEP